MGRGGARGVFGVSENILDDRVFQLFKVERNGEYGEHLALHFYLIVQFSSVCVHREHALPINSPRNLVSSHQLNPKMMRPIVPLANPLQD